MVLGDWRRWHRPLSPLGAEMSRSDRSDDASLVSLHIAAFLILLRIFSDMGLVSTET